MPPQGRRRAARNWYSVFIFKDGTVIYASQLKSDEKYWSLIVSCLLKIILIFEFVIFWYINDSYVVM
jgi:hypothetical protein